jgi:two-component system cell cycle response regulator
MGSSATTRPPNHQDGYSAIAVAQRDRPDLIILDLGLPAGDSFVVLKQLRESPALSHIPVIVLTARSPEFTEQEALQAGATAFFQKPADNSELFDVIRANLPNVSSHCSTHTIPQSS